MPLLDMLRGTFEFKFSETGYFFEGTEIQFLRDEIYSHC